VQNDSRLRVSSEAGGVESRKERQVRRDTDPATPTGPDHFGLDHALSPVFEKTGLYGKPAITGLWPYR